MIYLFREIIIKQKTKVQAEIVMTFKDVIVHVFHKPKMFSPQGNLQGRSSNPVKHRQTLSGIYHTYDKKWAKENRVLWDKHFAGKVLL